MIKEANGGASCAYVDVLPGKQPCVGCDGTKAPSNLEESKTVDMVNKPPHYTDGKYECIDVMLEVFGKEAVQWFCLLNSFKYIWRCKKKGVAEQDLKKSARYLDMYLKLEAQNG